MRRGNVQREALVVLAYAAALAVTVLAWFIPDPEGHAGYELALPALSLVLLSATWRTFGLAFLVFSFSVGHIRVHIGAIEFPLSDLPAIGLLVNRGLDLLMASPRARPFRPLQIYIAFAGAAACSALLSANPGGALYYTLRIYAFYGIAYLFGVMPVVRETLASTLRALLVPLVPMTLISIGLSIYRIVVLHDLWAEKIYSAGPFGSVQEVLPVTVILFWPFVRLLRQEATRDDHRRAYAIVEVLLFVCVFLGFAKTSWLQTLVTAIAIVILERSWTVDYRVLRRRILAFTVGAPLLGGFVAALLTLLNAGSFLHRAVQWVASFEFWLYHPVVGHGPGPAAALPFQSVAGFLLRKGGAMDETEPHGFVIKLLPEVGALGFLFYMAFWLSTFALVMPMFRSRDRSVFRRGIAAFAGLFGLITYLFASPDMFTGRAWLVFAVAAALATVRPQDADGRVR